jgi:hypothetical protein
MNPSFRLFEILFCQTLTTDPDFSRFFRFFRVEIGGKWFIVSDKLPWRVHMQTIRKEIPDPFDPSKTIPGTGKHFDDGHVTDDTNRGW